MMAEHNTKGQLFEYTVALIEKILCDNKETKLFRNYKLADQHGIKRELDIYVEVKVNNKTLKYAFECKNHKNGIPLTDIVDFNSKIEGKGISGYFVTTSQYQKGSREKASILNIELLRLKKRTIADDDIKSLLIFRRKFEIQEVQFFGSNSIYTTEEIASIIENCVECKQILASILQKLILPKIAESMDAGLTYIHPEFMQIENLRATLCESNAKELGFVGEMYETGVTHHGNKININNIVVTLKVWNEKEKLQPKSVNHFLYSYTNNEKEGLSFSMLDILVEESNLILCLVKDQDRHRVVLGPKNDIFSSPVHDAKFIASIGKDDLSDLFTDV